MQADPALSDRHQRDTRTQLGYRDRGQVERFQRLRVEPVKDTRMRLPALCFRNHVRIEQDHSKRAARAGDWMRALSDTTCKPNALAARHRLEVKVPRRRR